MIINHNLMANNAMRNMNINSNNASKSMQKLSSGLRINSAADDAAGLSISEKMRGQIRGLDQASANAQDGIAMTQTAEGALNETTSILQRMRELANQSANGTNTTADRSSIQDEMNQLTSEINRIGNTTEFNTQKLLDGGMTSNASSKVTKATSATVTLNAATGTLKADGAATVTASGSAATGTVSAVDLTINGKAFALSGVHIDATNTTTLTASAQALGNLTSADGTKLSDIANVSFGASTTLAITSKTKGEGTSIEFSADSTALGVTASSDKDTGENGTKVVVDNTTFDLGGVHINATNATTIATTIDNLKAVTSGGTKLGDLVDIKASGATLTFTDKSSGKTSTLEFTGTNADAALSLTATNMNTEVTGTDTTIERAGLEASSALKTTGDITIADNTTFKVAVGTESDVTVSLKAGTYNTSNADANVQKSAMDSLVKDLNSALQDAGLSGKVSASLSSDNKIQFISETGGNLKLTDGTNTPLASNLGFAGAGIDTDVTKNVNQIVGPGAQGSGFTTTFQIGANKGQSMSLSINDMRSAALGITGNAGQAGFTAENGVTNGTTDVKQEAALNLMTKEDASKALDVLDKATALVSAERGKLGAIQNRLEHTINNLGTSSENLTSAESRIRDVDMAKEMSTFSKNNILSQAAQAMLAQANQQPQQVLQLLR